MNLALRKIALILIVSFFIVAFLVSWFLFSHPQDNLILIKEGSNLSDIADQFKKKGIIKSSNLFVFFAQIMGKETGIKSGNYWLQEPESIFKLIKRLTKADFNLKMDKVVIFEGMTLNDIAEVFSKFNNFNKEEFLRITNEMEGYLFPDTYFVFPDISAEEVVKMMKKNFDKKAGEIDNPVLILASLIEKEVANPNDRRIVSGILWKRLEAGMPLQVDAVFAYIIEKTSSELTSEDLKINSPYNTYLYKGLPPTPICNPGLDAINAALNPQDSSYLYYLSDKFGNIHFAKTFEEHKFNKTKYLR
jgi:UPF0755 protein